MAIIPSGQACESCSYWITDPAVVKGQLPPNAGACNRYPPTPSNLGSSGSLGAWPLTYDYQWCGEYKGVAPGSGG